MLQRTNNYGLSTKVKDAKGISAFGRGADTLVGYELL
jgi:hypothetical protein